MPTLPLAGDNAALVDLSLAQRAETGNTLYTTYQVWLSRSASPAVLSRLQAEGVALGPVTRAAASRSLLDHGGLALAYDLALIVSPVALLLALGVMGFAVVSEGRVRRRELASLRLSGVSERTARRALMIENGLVLTTVLVVGGAIGFAAAALALPSLPEFPSGTGGVPIAGGVPAGPVVAALAVLALALGATVALFERSRGKAGMTEGAGIGVHLSGVVHLYHSPAGDVAALRGVDLDVSPGESIGLLGPSGAGKSTVLGLIAGDFRPSTGSVRVGSFDVGTANAETLSRLRAGTISLVVQGADANLLPYATARENVWFAQQGARRRGEAVELAPDDLLERFGLSQLADVPVDRMSAGQRQRVALVTGAAVLPKLLLVDEPTSQLGPDDRDAAVETIAAIHHGFGMTVVVVTHDPSVARRMERTVTIRDGRVGAEGRAGTEYAVVGRDGSVPLPPDVLDVLPPDSLVQVIRKADGIELRRAEGRQP